MLKVTFWRGIIIITYAVIGWRVYDIRYILHNIASLEQGCHASTIILLRKTIFSSLNLRYFEQFFTYAFETINLITYLQSYCTIWFFKYYEIGTLLNSKS